MMYLLIASILLVVLFVGTAIWRKRELPESISALVYDLPEGGWRWLWTIWIWAVSLLTFIPVIDILDQRNMGYVGFFALASMMFVGAWPLYQPQTRKAHYIGGVTAGILTQICVLLIFPWWLIIWFGLACVDISSRHAKEFPNWLSNKGILLAEGVCFIALIGAAFTKLLMS